jgi:hypothetical protein
MKTPIQELIDTLKELQETQDPYSLQDAIEFAQSMLEKEKEVIMNAFLDGYTHSPDDGFPEYARNYYNETFNTKEK